jgi:hypothetical protein
VRAYLDVREPVEPIEKLEPAEPAPNDNAVRRDGEDNERDNDLVVLGEPLFGRAGVKDGLAEADEGETKSLGNIVRTDEPLTKKSRRE